MESHIFKDHLLNQVIESQTTGRTTAHHDNGIRSHLQGFNKVSQNDLKGKADAFVRMEDTKGEGSSAGFRRKDYLHPCLPTTFFPAGRGLSSGLAILSFQAASAISS